MNYKDSHFYLSGKKKLSNCSDNAVYWAVRQVGRGDHPLFPLSKNLFLYLFHYASAVVDDLHTPIEF